jgi:hypothetical protein
MRIPITLLLLFAFIHTKSQVESDTLTDINSPIEKLKYKQQPGLALAASKIFFSDKRYSISGFGELNYVPVQGNINRNVGDLELYYSGLYRYATFFGYRITDKIIWNSEFQIEFLHDRTMEYHPEIVIEAFLDFLYKDYLKARIGFYPLTIGYVNNNDEPVMFYSVNRSEVERLIIPSTWIEFGTMFYGNISKKVSYALGFSQGLNSRNYLSGSWIRQGREIRFDIPKAISVNPQLIYTPSAHLTLSASGYFGKSGQGARVGMNNTPVDANIALGSAYAKYDWKNFSFVSVGTYGTLGDTEKIYELTKNGNNEGQVLGKEVYGYLLEIGYDILPWLRKNKEVADKHNKFYHNKEMKLSLFGRYERLNTHQSIHQELMYLPKVENNLHIWTGGINFNTRENIVIKANYQYRINKELNTNYPVNHIVETGIGFIF